MAASFLNDVEAQDAWMSEINTTPLVDVMLVLLIIFLLTVPVVSANVQLRLPTQSSAQQDTSVDYIIVSIDARGRLYLNDTPADNGQQLSAMIEPYAKLEPQPELHVRADGALTYSQIAPVMDMAQGFGFAQVQLLTLASISSTGKP